MTYNLNFGLPASTSMGFPYSPVGGNISYADALKSLGQPGPSPVAPPAVPTPDMMSAMMVSQGTGLAPTTSPMPQSRTHHPNTQPGMFGGAFKEGGMFQDGFLGGLGNLKDLASILGGFGMVYNGMQANKLAKDALGFQKQAYQKNLTNQVDSYNLALEDRIRARYAQNNRSSEEASSYIDQHRLEA